MTVIVVAEGEPLSLTERQMALVESATKRLKASLRPRLPLLLDDGGGVKRLNNLVGAVRLNERTMLHIEPKVDANEDWATAVLDLLLPQQRVEIGGERAGGLTPHRRDLVEALAFEYARRLRHALNRDGPMAVLVRRRETVTRFKGRLAVSEYLRNAWVRPHRFPVSFDELSTDNSFTRVLAVAAGVLASGVRDPRLRGELAQLAAAVRPGAPTEVPVSASDLHRPLPQQWAVYRPAWSIAEAVLSRAQLLGARGQRRGLEVVVEAWPLLETLLRRSLASAARLAQEDGRQWEAPRPRSRALLRPPDPATGLTGGPPRDVRPDGVLVEGGQVIASFEAKYSPGPPAKAEWPGRDDLFQTLATASAVSSPLAVLVYPGRFETRWWDVSGAGSPRRLAAVGMELFAYQRGTGEAERGKRLRELVDNAASATAAGAIAIP